MTERPRYPSDISDARWALVEPVLSAWQAERLARSPVPVKPEYPLREIWNALLYLNRTGVQWQYLPHDFPHYQSVNSYYSAWRDEGIFTRLSADMTQLARIREGRKPEPTTAGSSQAMINLAMIDNTSKRITSENTPTWRNWPADAPITPSTL